MYAVGTSERAAGPRLRKPRCFSLGRPDVLAIDDGALRATVSWLYHLDGEDSRAAIARIGEAWAPYRTCASLYLWNGLTLRRAEGWEPPR